MLILAYIDPGTTGLLAQFAAAGLAGVIVYFRSYFRRSPKDQPTPAEATTTTED